VLSLSAWVSVSGVVADLSTLQFCVHDTYTFESLCWYTPEPDFCGVVFLYLAAAPVAALARTLQAMRLPVRGWRF
jgi:hypothetical protein